VIYKKALKSLPVFNLSFRLRNMGSS